MRRRRLLPPLLALTAALTGAGCQELQQRRDPATLAQLLPRTDAERARPGAASVTAEPSTTDQTPKPVISYGAGVSVGGDRGQTAPITVGPGDQISLDFADADIPTVARAVLGDMLHLNYVIDPRVIGRITLQTARPLPREAVLSTIEDAFRMNGAALVESGDQIRVVPAEGGKFSLGAARIGPARGPGWRTQIVPLRFASAAEVQKAIDAMVPAGSSVVADKIRNILIVTGSGTEIANLMDVISVFDNDTMAGLSFGLFPLREVEAKTLAGDLEGIFGHADDKDPQAPLRILPIQRLNAILVMAREREGLKRVQDWIARLDQIGEGNEPQLFVYRVTSGRASYLAEEMAKLFPSEAIGKVGRERAGSVSPDRRSTETQSPGFGDSSGAATGRSGLSGSTSSSFGATGFGKNAAAPLGNTGFGGATQPGQPPTGSDPNTPDQSTANTGATQSGASDPNGKPNPDSMGVRIVADTVNNALLVMARPAVYKRMEQALRKLDVTPAQVQIEATIAEVQLNNELKFGTEYFLKSGSSGFRFSPNNDGSIAASAPGFTYNLATRSAQVILNTLRSVSDVTVISSPTMLVLDNETANLQVGDQVPVVTTTSQSTITGNAPLVSQIELHDTGVILSVTPRVTASGLVILDIHQEVSDVVATTSSKIDSPTFRRRRFDSSVAMADGQTVALGGLIRSNNDREQAGLPGLSQIPFVGLLFGDRSNTTSRTELLVMITPRIVRSASDAAAATDELRRRLSELATPEPKITP